MFGKIMKMEREKNKLSKILSKDFLILLKSREEIPGTYPRRRKLRIFEYQWY